MNTALFALLLLLSSPVLLCAAQACQSDPNYPGWNPSVYSYVYTVSVTNANVSAVVPAVVTPPGAEIYLGESSCLGYLGPIGPYGPLGSLGPIGADDWHPSYWISGDGMDWSNFSKEITGLGGPLSANGPLGYTGPLSPNSYFNWLPCIDDFAAHLAAAGLWTVLGPLGPLGPLGALGPLGPIGAHGYHNDSNGQYLDNAGNVVRTITVPYDTSSQRTWELYEYYTQKFAIGFSDNDCSFLVEGIAGEYGDNGDIYSFTSHYDQYVTILLVPLKQLDDFDMQISINGNQLINSNTTLFIEWVQIRVPKNTKITAHVVLSSSGHMLQKDYRLYVTGSSQWFDATNIKGAHIINYNV